MFRVLCCNNFFKSKGERILRILEAKAFWILLLSVVLLQLVIFLTSYKQYLVPQSCVINFFAALQSLNEPNRYQNVIYIYIIYNIYIYIIYIEREVEQCRTGNFMICKIDVTLFDVTWWHLRHIFDSYAERRNSGELEKYLCHGLSLVIDLNRKVLMFSFFLSNSSLYLPVFVLAPLLMYS